MSTDGDVKKYLQRHLLTFLETDGTTSINLWLMVHKTWLLVLILERLRDMFWLHTYLIDGAVCVKVSYNVELFLFHDNRAVYLAHIENVPHLDRSIKVMSYKSIKRI